MQADYEVIGRFIYGAHRHGAQARDAIDWIADDLGVARPTGDDTEAMLALIPLFCASYPGQEERQARYARFIASLQHPGPDSPSSTDR